jgi:LacI family transcriptional regulator
VITLKTLANELNLSTATVSMALNSSPLIAEGTKAKVKALAKKREYVPNHLGRSLQARKSHVFGYLLSNVTASFFDEILQGIGTECSNNHYGLMAGCIAQNQPEAVESQLQILLEKNVDGIIFSLSDRLILPHVERLNRRKIPFIFCSSPSERYSYVATDDFKGGQLAAEYLLNCGHRHVLCSESSAARLSGNLDVKRRYKSAQFTPFKSISEIPGQIRNKQITAIIAYSDFQAIDIMWMLKSQGFSIPRDISIVGFDDIWFASRPEFELTTIAQQRSLLGKTAMIELMRIVNHEIASSRTLLNPALVVRNTVRRL